MTPPSPTQSEAAAGSPLPALLLGILMGVAILKLGNPVILEDQIGHPEGLSEWIARPWPTRTGLFLMPVPVAAVLLLTHWRRAWVSACIPRWIWVPFAIWLGWQVVSTTHTIDPRLTHLTLPHLVSIAVCFVAGVALGAGNWKPILLGVSAGACICWLQAINQHTVEFRVARESLILGQQTGWTNIAPAELTALRTSGLVIRTNGVDIANPAILDKLERGRVHGSLVYPNALAGLVLLALPALAASVWATRSRLRPAIFYGTFVLLTGLGIASLLWSGSRSGWLIAITMACIAILLLPTLRRFRIPIVVGILLLGGAAFAIRNKSYFEKGASSMSARLDYWKVATQNTVEHPLVGSGPGTFMRPYARLKPPEAEMARLAHNDYLQQFTDSGIPGGVAYLAWILGSIGVAWTRVRQSAEPVLGTAILLGTTGWLVQGFSEFSLYVPALSWIAFVFLGITLGMPTQSAPTFPPQQKSAP